MDEKLSDQFKCEHGKKWCKQSLVTITNDAGSMTVNLCRMVGACVCSKKQGEDARMSSAQGVIS